MKARREIADYMKNKRTERARIRVSYCHLMTQYSSTSFGWMIPIALGDVILYSLLLSCDIQKVEHIIREDYLVEAMEVVELYCDLLLARFGMLEQMS